MIGFSYSSVLAVLVVARKFIPALLMRRRRIKADFNHQLNNDRSLIFVLRVYEEAESVSDVLGRWRTTTLAKSGCSLIVVGSAAERKGSRPTTIDAFESYLKQPEFEGLGASVFIYETPAPAGIARQTNYGLQSFMGNQALQSASAWVKTIDIDTMLSSEVLNELVAAINDNCPAIEIPASFDKNYRQLDSLQRWHAAYQDHWSTDYEQLRGFLKNRFPIVYSGISGAGGCLRVDVLDALGGFPENVAAEDLALSWSLNVRRVPLRTLHSRLSSDVPKTFMEGFSQEIRWSEGAIDAAIYALQRAAAERKLGGGVLLPVLATLWANLVWALASPVLFGLTYLAVALSDPLLAIPVIVSAVSYGARFFEIERRTGGFTWNSAAHLLLIPVQLARISIPWWVALVFKALPARRRGKSVVRKSSH